MQSTKSCVAALAIVALLAGCSKPTETIIPSDVSKWDTDLAPQIQKLAEEDKKLIAAYLVRAKLGEAFGKEGMPIGTTIADGIASQKQWNIEQEKKVAEEKALKERLAKEAAEAKAAIDGAVTVALVNLKRRFKNYDAGRYSDEQEIAIGIENKGSKEIKGVSGRLIFVDVFDKDVGTVSFDVTAKIAPGATYKWEGSRKYNEFIAEHRNVWNLREGDYKTRFEPSAIVFADGTKLSAVE